MRNRMNVMTLLGNGKRGFSSDTMPGMNASAPTTWKNSRMVSRIAISDWNFMGKKIQKITLTVSVVPVNMIARPVVISASSMAFSWSPNR